MSVGSSRGGVASAGGGHPYPWEERGGTNAIIEKVIKSFFSVL